MAHCAATLLLIAGLGLAGHPQPVAGANATASHKVVFVDKAELARLHPGWQALSDMKAVLSGETTADVAAHRGGVAPPSNPGSAAGRSRAQLAAKAAADASAALDTLEARRYQALQARCAAMKAQLLKGVEASWKAEAREIERSAAAETKAIDEAYSADLINARLKASASAVEAKVSKSDSSGMDKASVDAQVKEVQRQLESVESAHQAAKDRIRDEARAKIDALRQDAERRVDEQVAAYEAGQRILIAKDIASARAEIARELGPSSAPLLFAGKSEMTSDDSADLSAAVSALQSRIDSDVSSVVQDLAAKRGLRVIFDRRGAGAKDATGSFAALIKKYGWPAGSIATGKFGSS